MNTPNCPNILMDWFKRNGMDGSFRARENLFRIRAPKEKYKATAQQNIYLLKWLKENFGPWLN